MEPEKKLLSIRSNEPEPSVLYVVGTPIGNLNDISIRTTNLLSKVSLIACEDTRRTRILLNVLKIKNKLISFNKLNSRVKTTFIIDELKKGQTVALVSDAGMPLISDPGEYLVKEALVNNLEVICSPGPCAALTALVSSGIDSSKFQFIGFIPKKNVERETYLKMIAKCKTTTIVYESPKRINLFLKDLGKYCKKTRIIHVAKELTKRHEKHWRGSLENIYKELNTLEHKGEFTIIISGIESEDDSNKIKYEEIKKDLEDLILLGLKRSSAASFLAKKNGLSKNFIYNLN